MHFMNEHVTMLNSRVICPTIAWWEPKEFFKDSNDCQFPPLRSRIVALECKEWFRTVATENQVEETNRGLSQVVVFIVTYILS